ncbi:hypothetical protein HS088_TW15G01289 [Tripterygium wilfordii]|uniref:Uncharacterized protein n=1 Tax=Tripterygium wilfordii TaxID=458696 RepID=A0A7J7CNW3_TRIWF|nr:hypothetical protein HS088_TW15G01289 [Tripterygium wilfordii]
MVGSCGETAIIFFFPLEMKSHFIINLVNCFIQYPKRKYRRVVILKRGKFFRFEPIVIALQRHIRVSPFIMSVRASFMGRHEGAMPNFSSMFLLEQFGNCFIDFTVVFSSSASSALVLWLGSKLVVGIATIDLNYN